MSDGVLAAIIAAGATVFTSFLQIRTSLAKEFAARGTGAASRRKSRLPLLFVIAMLVGAAVGGFALAQWLHEYERVAQDALRGAERGMRVVVPGGAVVRAAFAPNRYAPRGLALTVSKRVMAK